MAYSQSIFLSDDQPNGPTLHATRAFHGRRWATSGSLIQVCLWSTRTGTISGHVLGWCLRLGLTRAGLSMRQSWNYSGCISEDKPLLQSDAKTHLKTFQNENVLVIIFFLTNHFGAPNTVFVFSAKWTFPWTNARCRGSASHRLFVPPLKWSPYHQALMESVKPCPQVKGLGCSWKRTGTE